MKALRVEEMRRGQDALGAIGASVLHNRVAFSPEEFENFSADWALPITEHRDGVILYLHGGSYSAGSLSYSRGFGGLLADKTGRITLCVAYRLAPENPFPAALDDALAAYLKIQEIYPSQKISLVGESAGGGLCYCLALLLKKLGLPQPACIVTISPWTDLSCSGETFLDLADQDPCLFPESLQWSAGKYSLGDVKNPLISPLFGDFHDLAPSLVFVGTLELLLDNSTRLAERYAECGSYCELHIVDDVWHAYVLYGIPEAKTALERIDEFLCEENE